MNIRNVRFFKADIPSRSKISDFALHLPCKFGFIGC